MNQDLPEKSPSRPQPSTIDSLGLGIFCAVAGALLLAELIGVIPQVKWFIPLALLAFGITTVLRVAFRRK